MSESSPDDFHSELQQKLAKLMREARPLILEEDELNHHRPVAAQFNAVAESAFLNAGLSNAQVELLRKLGIYHGDEVILNYDHDQPLRGRVHVFSPSQIDQLSANGHSHNGHDHGARILAEKQNGNAVER